MGFRDRTRNSKQLAHWKLYVQKYFKELLLQCLLPEVRKSLGFGALYALGSLGTAWGFLNIRGPADIPEGS